MVNIPVDSCAINIMIAFITGVVFWAPFYLCFNFLFYLCCKSVSYNSAKTVVKRYSEHRFNGVVSQENHAHRHNYNQ